MLFCGFFIIAVSETENLSPPPPKKIYSIIQVLPQISNFTLEKIEVFAAPIFTGMSAYQFWAPYYYSSNKAIICRIVQWLKKKLCIFY